jgi:hypothetical protein
MLTCCVINAAIAELIHRFLVPLYQEHLKDLNTKHC